MLAHALRDRLRSGYGLADLRVDVMAGLVVGVMALPLAMALAVASGVPPQHGLYTSIVAGALAALLGGSRLSVTGPTAAFVALLAPTAAKFGLGGLLLATMMAGAILLGMGLARLGRLIQYIPHPVTSGFTAGIAVVIALLQVKDLLGLDLVETGPHFLERVHDLAVALPAAHLPDAVAGLVTLAAIVLWSRFGRGVPAPLIAVPLAAVAAWALARAIPGFDAATIASRFTFTTADGVLGHGIPTGLPTPTLPWLQAGAGGEAPLGLSFETLRAMLGPAFTIAMLGAIESLLCAVVADGMAGTRHDPDAELVGQGIGNLVAPLFGGIAATGAIARTAANVRAGARSPIAAVTHALLVLLAMVSLAPLLGHVPMASLAALLLVAAWNMSDARHVVHVTRVAPRSDVAVLFTCLALTVVFDMVIAVSVGVVLAALLFMRRMVSISSARLHGDGAGPSPHVLPDGVLLYEIAGPLFFGAAEKAVAALYRIQAGPRAVILDLSRVPVMDVTGLVALESAIAALSKGGAAVVVAGAPRQPRLLVKRAFRRAGASRVRFARDIPQAIALLDAARPPGG